MADYTALNSKARKQFYEKLRDYFGLPPDFSFGDDLLFVSSKNRYFVMDRTYVEVVNAGYNVKVLGNYIAEINEFGEIRLSIEGSQMIGPHATSHLLELSPEDVERFIRGADLDISVRVKQEGLSNHYYIIWYTDTHKMKHYLGCAKIKNGTLFNFTPKNRRIRD